MRMMRTNGSDLRRLLLLSLVGSIALAAEAGARPRAYFTGQVCEGRKAKVERLDGRSCKPLDGVTVTLENARGVSISTKTDAEGKYSIPPIELFGTREDRIVFEKEGRVAFEVCSLSYAADDDASSFPPVRIKLQERVGETRKIE